MSGVRIESRCYRSSGSLRGLRSGVWRVSSMGTSRVAATDQVHFKSTIEPDPSPGPYPKVKLSTRFDSVAELNSLLADTLCSDEITILAATES